METIYLVKQNENLTDGHGEDITVVAFTNKSDAEATSKVLDGIMSSFDGTFEERPGVEVVELKVCESLDEYPFAYKRVMEAKINEQTVFEKEIYNNHLKKSALSKLTNAEKKALNL